MEPAITPIDYELTFGVLGIAGGLIMAYYVRKARRVLGSHSQASATMVFSGDEVYRSLLLVAVTTLLLAGGMLAGAFGMFYSVPQLDLLSRLGVAAGILGMITFFRSVATSARGKEFSEMVGEIARFRDEKACHEEVRAGAE
ncbi:MAG: hypothetical protein SV186_06650 [Candidatus Nanohaloarchaea archaeon]|nr:hypothetical protein [Candidatus Nanohaloarchaea archaeon]